MELEITALGVVLLAYAVVSGRLRGTAITPAIVFTGVGYVLGTEGLNLVGGEIEAEPVRLLAEVTLTLVLFSDASALHTGALRREKGTPLRLLAIGLPLMIVFGVLIALPMFPDLGLFEVIVLAVLLAPTDAALGQTVVSDERLPSRLRQGLNVESGLNDGICVPLLFAAVAFAELDEAPTFDGGIVVDLVKEVGVATAVGAAVAAAVATALTLSERRDWLDEKWSQVVPLATAAVGYAAAADLGGSGFIAAFVAGLVYRQMVGSSRAHETTKLAEEVGGVLSAVTFFVFGTTVIGRGITELDLATVAYAVLSLTVVRMIPVAVALIGSGAAPQTMAFAGWFGPRGLATIVFMLTIVGDSNLAGTGRIVEVATVTVVLSVIAHGVSAAWLTDRYVDWFSTRAEYRVSQAHDEVDLVQPPRRSLWH
ncbi:MAG: cation:proton antiporter [Acidimicrobiia bacterium]|nr:cation:proton antiporter [Acidimicrobiia bacterium]MDH5518991.1 cation:proton antiporter [Acidimicrobiia bacterium]